MATLSVNAGIVGRWRSSQGIGQSAGRVTSWSDLSGNAGTLTAASANAPNLISGALGTAPAVVFDGSTHFMSSPTVAGLPVGAQSRSVFAVVRYDSNGVGGFSWGAPGNNGTFGVAVSVGGAAMVHRWGVSFDLTSTTTVNGVGWITHSAVFNSAGGWGHYVNGAQIAGSASTETLATNSGGSISLGREIDGSPLVAMGVAEIIVYNRALSDAERLNVEAYLHAQYGVGAEGLPVVDGLSGHWVASASVGTSGSAVSTWRDGSGGGCDLTVSGGSPTLSATAVNGRPAVVFDGVDDSMASAGVGGLPTGNTNRSMFAVVRYDSNGVGGFTWGTNTNNAAFGLVVSSAGNAMVQRWGTSFDRESSTLVNGAGWLSHSTIFNSSTGWAMYVNGASVAGTSNLQTLATAAGDMVFGTEIDGAPFASLQVAELVVYSRALSESERIQLENYFHSRYGVGIPAVAAIQLTAPLVQATPTSDEGTLYRTTLDAPLVKATPTSAEGTLYAGAPVDPGPTVTSGLVSWFRADSGLQLADDGHTVTGWLDGQGSNDLTAVGTVERSELSDEPAVLVRDGGHLLQGSATGLPTGTGARSIFAVVQYEPDGFGFGGVGWGNASADGMFFLGSEENGTSSVAIDSAFVVDSSVVIGNSAVTVAAILEAGEVSLYVDGLARGSFEVTTATGGTTLAIGQDSAGGAPASLRVAELLIYNRALDESERLLIEGYLEQRYEDVGLPSANALAVPTDGLVSRLRGSSGLVTAGSTITAWDDEIVGRPSLTPTGSPLTTLLNGRLAAAFDGVDDILSAPSASGLPLGNSERSVFAVVRYRSAGHGGITWGAPQLNQAFGLIVTPQGEYAIQRWGVQNDRSSGVAAVGTGWHTHSVAWGSGGWVHYRDSHQIAASGPETLATSGAAYVIGAELDRAPRVAMDVAEVLVYDRVLGDTERLAVEAYFFAEYGVGFGGFTSAVVTGLAPRTVPRTGIVFAAASSNAAVSVSARAIPRTGAVLATSTVPVHDYRTEALDRLVSQYRDRTRIVSLLLSFVEEVQSLESAMAAVSSALRYEGAYGALLDVYGEIVGIARDNAMDGDGEYRRWIDGKRLANQSEGRVADLLAVCYAVLPPGYVVSLTEHGPATSQIDIKADSVDPVAGTRISVLLNAASAAGTRILVTFSMFPDGQTFRFSSDTLEPELFSPHGFGAGRLAVVMDTPRNIGLVASAPAELFAGRVVAEYYGAEVSSLSRTWVVRDGTAGTIANLVLSETAKSEDNDGPNGLPYARMRDGITALATLPLGVPFVTVFAVVRPYNLNFVEPVRVFGITAQGETERYLSAAGTAELAIVSNGERKSAVARTNDDWIGVSWVIGASGIQLRAGGVIGVLESGESVQIGEATLRLGAAPMDIAYLSIVELEQVSATDYAMLSPWFLEEFNVEL